MVIKGQNLIKTLVSIILLSSLFNSNAMDQVDDTSIYNKIILAPSSMNSDNNSSSIDVPKRPASC